MRKNILFIHGAVKNAGDFLIAYRSQKLLESLISNCNISSFYEKTDFGDKKYKEILDNSFSIVFAGGPFFTNNIFPNDVTHYEKLLELKIPMINVGGGWFGKDDSRESVENYHLNQESISVLNKIISDSGCLSCRDNYTIKALEANGLTNAALHGCPAWYDIDFVNEEKLSMPTSIKRICVSDPARETNDELIIPLFDYLRRTFPCAEMVFVYHRDVRDNQDIKRYFVEKQVRVVYIADDYKGFSIYDSCQLHIGFRVHAHIYNLSHRNLSVLIEEDGRGAGVDEALGLSRIHSYKRVSDINNIVRYERNYSYINEIEEWLVRCRETDCEDYKKAFTKMKICFEKMSKHISVINNWL